MLLPDPATEAREPIQKENERCSEDRESAEGDARAALRAPAAKDVQQVKVVIEPRHK